MLVSLLMRDIFKWNVCSNLAKVDLEIDFLKNNDGASCQCLAVEGSGTKSCTHPTMLMAHQFVK